jgi:Flp pilus assembly pilin Flp
MLEHCRNALRSSGSESGQTLAEYTLIFAFIVLAAVGLLALLALGLAPLYQPIIDVLPS